MTPHESPDPTEAALVARLEAAGWSADIDTGQSAVTIRGATGETQDWEHLFLRPTVVAALTDACKEVGA